MVTLSVFLSFEEISNLQKEHFFLSLMRHYFKFFLTNKDLLLHTHNEMIKVWKVNQFTSIWHL